MNGIPAWMIAFALVPSSWAADPTPAAPSAGATAPLALPAPSPAAQALAPVSPSNYAPPVPIAPVDYKKFRDPFKEPSVVEASEVRSDLERYAVTDFKVVAIITGPIRMRAMLTAPDGKTHYVSERMKIGLRDGVIVKITTKTIVVREKVVNPLGEVEQFDTEIGMDAPASGTSQ